MDIKTSTILACAGRRIDTSDASPSRFPLDNVYLVSQRVEAVFREHRVMMVVSSAACGADIIVLQVAQRWEIPFRIILPFSPEQFRTTSVVDRPSSPIWDWGRLYDQLIGSAQRAGNLKILEGTSEGLLGYQAVNQALVREAITLGKQQAAGVDRHGPVQVQALMIWDGQPRGSTDLTLSFANEARAHGLPVLEILTRSSMS